VDFKFVKFEVFIPEEYVDKLRDALNEIGALTIGGNYDSCMSVTRVTGYWRPLEGAAPFNGTVGELCQAEECKVEFSSRRELLKETMKTIIKVHPYETPVINVLPVINGVGIKDLLD